jgi:hypothetical protein
LVAILNIPNIGAVVFVAKSFIIHDKVIVTQRLFPTDILLLVNFLKYPLRLFNLQDISNKLWHYSPHIGRSF